MEIISEEVPMLEKRLVKRKMESKRVEVRRLHIIYFLSRMGKVEHPHLIRVHHMNRSGVHLRDVKRWLSDLRGKDMPDSFSWSYKRQYKTGYVWQDLLDDDLITPIADNEYVLKGSEISAFPLDQCASAVTATSIQIPDPVEDKTLQCTTVKNPEANSDSSCKPEETKMEKAHSVKRRVTFKLEVEGGGGGDGKSVDAEPVNDDLKGIKIVTDGCFDATTPLGDDHGLKKDGRKGEKSQASSTFSFTSSKTRRSSAASQVFLNILKCGAVDAKESATVKVGRDRKAASDTAKKAKGEICNGEICKVVEGVGVGGSERGFGGTWNQQKHPQIARNISFDGTKSSRKKSAVADQKPVFGTCKPIAEPNCSQCGKHFKPEKLHTHMKSCRAMKSRGGKGGPAAEKMPGTAKNEFTTTTKEPSPESPLLAHCSLHQSY